MSRAFGRWVIFCGPAILGADRQRLGLEGRDLAARASTTGLGEEEARALHADLGRAIEHAWGPCCSRCTLGAHVRCSCGALLCDDHGAEHIAETDTPEGVEAHQVAFLRGLTGERSDGE